MVRRIKDNVAVDGRWFQRGASAVEVGEAAAAIGDHNWVDDGVPESTGAGVDASSTSASAPASPAVPVPAAMDGAGPGRPPEHGAGASAQAWREYARSVGIAVSDDATRGDVIAAVQKHEATG
jgi:hypothetical protein